MSRDVIVEQRIAQATLSAPPGQDDVRMLEAAFGVALPADYIAFMRQFGGGQVRGPRASLYVWPVSTALAMYRENEHTARSSPTQRLAYFGSDGGSFELFFDIDDRFGRGAFAVLAADRASARIEHHGRDFTEALIRVVDGGAMEGEPCGVVDDAVPPSR